MSRSAAHLRTLTALLLLLLGQLGAALPAHAAACRRAQDRALPAAVLPAVLAGVTPPAADALTRAAHPGPGAADPAPASAAVACGAVALPESAAVEIPLPATREVPCVVRGEDSPGRLFTTSFFRPPRTS